MKSPQNKSFLTLILFLGGLLILGAVFFLSGLAKTTLYWLSKVASGLYSQFAYATRFKIAYLSAIIILAGLFFLALRKAVFLLHLKQPWLQVWNSLKEAALKNRTVVLVGCGFLVILSGLFFYLFNFPYAFFFASLVMIGFLVKYNREGKKLFILGIIIVLLFWSPYLFQGENYHVKIFDNLDCHIPQTKVLAESGKAFSLNPDTRLDNFINGLPLSGVDSGYNVMTWLFMIFPPFMAYALNDLLVRLVAFVGMLLLLQRYIVKPEKAEHRWINIGAAVCFSLLPFYPAGGISIAGIPLLLYSFLNIKNQKGKLGDFLIIFIFPFYSKLALAGIFIGIALFIVFIVDLIRKKRINFPFLGGLALLTILYCFTHFHLLYAFLSPGFVSFREEIQAVGVPTSKALRNTTGNFLFDRVNVVNAQHIFILGAAALAVLIGIFKKVRIRLLAGLIFMTLATSILWGFKYWTPLIPLREKFQLITAFDFGRFYWFNPFLWYVIFALALLVILKLKYGKVIVSLFIIGQLLFMFMNYNWEIRHLMGIRSSFAGSPLTYSLSYKEFYSQPLLNEISQYINRPQEDYRVISLGIPPGISQYNGFYTLDIYTDIYPLEYKHRFRKIIEKELEKSALVKRVFDENGKRCYLFAADLQGVKGISGMVFSRGITKRDGRRLKVRHLDLDYDVLKEMGGEYIFSAVEILDTDENRLHLEKVFERKDSPWKIYLYKVI